MRQQASDRTHRTSPHSQERTELRYGHPALGDLHHNQLHSALIILETAMGAKEAGPSSGKQEPPSLPPCTHRRMVEDERTPAGEKSGRLICMECGTVLSDTSPN